MYEALVESYGPAFIGPYVEADIYAQAMCLGSSQLEVKRAAGQQNPATCTEMLPGQLTQYGIVPLSTSSNQTRRNALAAAMTLRNGARIDALTDGLRGILGANLIAVVVNEGTQPSWDTPGTAGTGIDPIDYAPLYKPPSTTITVVSSNSYIMPSGSPQTVAVSHAAGEPRVLALGERVVVAPNKNGLSEVVTVTAPTSATTISGIFTKAHDVGTLITTAPFPNQIGYQDFVQVIVASNAAGTALAIDATTLKSTNRFLSKWLGATTTFAVVPEDGEQISGELKIGQGLIGVTPFGTTGH